MSSSTPSSNNQHPIAQQLAALQTMKQKSASPSPSIPPSPVTPQKTHFTWTGFQGKTAWDWLDFLVKLLGALAIPLVVFLASNDLNTQQQQTAETQHQNELTIADDQQKETTLKAYLDDMTNLLLNNKLNESKPTDEVRTVARVKTLTTVRRLDGTRKNILLQFIYEAKLINSPKPIMDISDADLSGADMFGANLHRANLSRINLRGADLFGADLSSADLSRTDISGADMIGVDLRDANLRGTILFDAEMSGSDLREANLRRTNLIGADLRDANLRGTNLSSAGLNRTNLSRSDLRGANLRGTELGSADLRGADLRGADLRGADLFGVDLTGAIVTNAQLATAYSLEGTILPNGFKNP